jgi:hypothetical protein
VEEAVPAETKFKQQRATTTKKKILIIDWSEKKESFNRSGELNKSTP